MNDEVTQYISDTAPWQKAVCEKLRAMIHETVPGVEEQLQYGKPHFLKNGNHAAVIAVARGKVSFMVFNAMDIPTVKGLIRAMGKGDRKCADIAEGQDADYAALAEILEKTTIAL
ncbi:DUF1801 domain-containing protein [Nonomuraea sp. LPB2021202275-12-8]|uniref:DUF1801 domain-containing protein n=1 Tax=Nonomuraea sp. LPB2021202275-12-8 TaxID=3120159 RepID=UPI00300C4C12